jgi:thiol-disulfide isomerase/thioredoxin
MKYFCILVFSIFIIGTVSAQKPAEILPDFTFFKLTDNKPFTEKDLPKGKMLFFIFFDPECGHCQHSIQYIGKQYQHFKKAAVYLVTLENPDKVKYFMDTYGRNLKNQPNLMILRDLNQQFLPRFKPRKYPSMFLYSPQKKLIDYQDEQAAIDKFFKQIKANSK